MTAGSSSRWGNSPFTTSSGRHVRAVAGHATPPIDARTTSATVRPTSGGRSRGSAAIARRIGVVFGNTYAATHALTAARRTSWFSTSTIGILRRRQRTSDIWRCGSRGHGCSGRSRSAMSAAPTAIARGLLASSGGESSVTGSHGVETLRSSGQNREGASERPRRRRGHREHAKMRAVPSDEAAGGFLLQE